MNKYIKLLGASAILSLTSFIPLSNASENATGNGAIQLASSFAAYSYEGEPCCNKGCCGGMREEVHYKVHHKHHRKHHHKKHHKHHKKHHHKHHYKSKQSCGCQYS